MESVRFVGMDVHKDSIQMAVLSDQRHGAEIEFERQVASDPAAVKKVIRRVCREHRVVAGYEAGCMGYHLQRSLHNSGVECVVIAPSSIARAPGDRVKTDRRDAVAIARLLRNGEGQQVHVGGCCPSSACSLSSGHCSAVPLFRTRDALGTERPPHTLRAIYHATNLGWGRATQPSPPGVSCLMPPLCSRAPDGGVRGHDERSGIPAKPGIALAVAESPLIRPRDSHLPDCRRRHRFQPSL